MNGAPIGLAPGIAPYFALRLWTGPLVWKWPQQPCRQAHRWLELARIVIGQTGYPMHLGLGLPGATW